MMEEGVTGVCHLKIEYTIKTKSKMLTGGGKEVNVVKGKESRKGGAEEGGKEKTKV